MGDAVSFGLQLDRELTEALDELRELIIQIAEEALTLIVNRTPVLTGKARANWNLAIGNNPPIVLTTEVDPSGAVTIARGLDKIAEYRRVNGMPNVTIYNDLEYILRLENGYSLKAPEGMVAITQAELQVFNGV